MRAVRTDRLPMLAAAGALAGAAAVHPGGGLAGINGSKHDLGTGGGAQETTTVTSEICIFCHTPHGSSTDLSAPLWNKTLPSVTYQRYSDLGSATLDGQEVAIGSVSLACLSCHDGTQAMDVVINMPGSGGFNPAGQEVDPGSIGLMSGTPIPNLGVDLRDDHPVSIAYAGGACTGVFSDCDPSGATVGDVDFEIAQYETINDNHSWWVDVSAGANAGTANVREQSDMILYTRSFDGTEGPSIECGSCHDPHEDVARPVSFLRISNADSELCFACHVK